MECIACGRILEEGDEFIETEDGLLCMGCVDDDTLEQEFRCAGNPCDY